MYCKFCGSENLKEIPVVRETRDETKKELIGSIPHFRGRFQKTKNDRLQYSIDEICCEICLNYAVETKNKPLQVEISNDDKQIVIIPENLINVLKHSSISDTEIESGIHRTKTNLDKVYNNYVKNGGRNTCKNYKMGEAVIFSFPYSNPFPCWIIIDFMNSELHFRLSFGGKDIHCR